MKIVYSRHELWQYAKNAIKSLTMGLAMLLWTIILLFINIAITTFSWLKKFVMSHPPQAVGVTFFIMLIVCILNYADMKSQLDKVTCQKEVYHMKLDSISEAHDKTGKYTQYQNYEVTDTLVQNN